MRQIRSEMFVDLIFLLIMVDDCCKNIQGYFFQCLLGQFELLVVVLKANDPS